MERSVPIPTLVNESGKTRNLRKLVSDHNDSSVDDVVSHALDSQGEKSWTPLISSDQRELKSITGLSAAAKRLEDFIFGSIALVILFPLMVLISVLIKLDSTGPALFCQARNGRNGEIIKVYKFRTMFQNASAEFKQAERGDSRITRVGNFLRKTSLDELPQLFNVIQGSMSLVGPRPHPLKLDEDFQYVIPSLHSRYCVKPGITGWAQINGFRGETRRVSDMISRIEHDRYYIEHWSLFLDIKVLVLTVLRGWTHKNAY
jgi:putative colanic acid biosynthesis UDP-glucose lipid carrier transferase